MHRCPNCGYVDPASVIAKRRHEAKRRGKRDRSEYMAVYNKTRRMKKAREIVAEKSRPFNEEIAP